MNVLGCYFDLRFDLGICIPLDLGENTGIKLWLKNNEKKRPNRTTATLSLGLKTLSLVPVISTGTKDGHV